MDKFPNIVALQAEIAGLTGYTAKHDMIAESKTSFMDRLRDYYLVKIKEAFASVKDDMRERDEHTQTLHALLVEARDGFAYVQDCTHNEDGLCGVCRIGIHDRLTSINAVLEKE